MANHKEEKMITKFLSLLIVLLFLAGVGYLIFVDVPVPQTEITKEIILPQNVAPAAE